MKENKKKLSQAMLFIILFGIVSLFSDMTHEGASSIRGAYLSLLGASAASCRVSVSLSGTRCAMFSASSRTRRSTIGR